jgi:hypothetical protein
MQTACAVLSSVTRPPVEYFSTSHERRSRRMAPLILNLDGIEWSALHSGRFVSEKNPDPLNRRLDGRQRLFGRLGEEEILLFLPGF